MTLSEPSDIPETARVITSVILSVFLVLAIVGNMISLIVLYRLPRPCNANMMFIAALSIISLTHSIIGLPFEISRFYFGSWEFGQGTACSMFAFAKYFNVGMTSATVGLIAVNRMVIVTFRQCYSRLYGGYFVYIQISVIVLFSLITLMPTILAQWGRFGFDADLQTCTVVPVDGRSSKQALFVIGFLMPSLVICLCYSVIVVVLVRSRRRLNSHITITAGSTRNKLCTGEERHVAILGAALFIVFVLCYIPLTIIKLTDPNNERPFIHIFGYITMYSSLWVNPILYICLNTQYRAVFMVTICKRPSNTFNKSISKQRSTVSDTIAFTSIVTSPISKSQIAPASTVPVDVETS